MTGVAARLITVSGALPAISVHIAAGASGGGGDVASVNGQTGVVVLDHADVGAVADDDPRLSDARTPTAHTHVAADITDLPSGGSVGSPLEPKIVGALAGRPNGSVTGTTNITSSLVSWFPFQPNWDCAIDRLYVEITTGGAPGTLGRLSMYAADSATGLPSGEPIEVLGEFAADEAATVSLPFAEEVALAAGDMVWFAVQASASAGFRTATIVFLGGISPSSVSVNSSSLRQSAPYASGAPTAAAEGSYSSSPILILPRVSS